MSPVASITPRFVEEIPETPAPGQLYVSLEHRTMIHLCACGCGNEVVLPLSPADWRFTYDGEAISVWPSVGSWSLPCRSHYVISGSCIRWTNDWSEEEVAAGRAQDRVRQAARYSNVSPQPKADIAVKRVEDEEQGSRPVASLLKWLRSWFG
jgi:Family of unknown function (DUF6527)